MSAETKLMPRPPARVVRRNTNLSLPGALYSSIAAMRSSCAVPPSILQYPALNQHLQMPLKAGSTMLAELAVVLQNV